MFGAPIAGAVIHGKITFSSSGSFVVPHKITTLTKVVVANCGGFSGAIASPYGAGGGGGGEVCYAQNVPVTAGTVLTITLNPTPTSKGTARLAHPALGNLDAAFGEDGVTSSTVGPVAGDGGAGGGVGGGAGGAGSLAGPEGANGGVGGNASATGSDVATWAGVTISRYYGGGGGGGAADWIYPGTFTYVGGTGGNNSNGDAGSAGSNTAVSNGGGGGGGGGAITISGVTGPHALGAFDVRGGVAPTNGSVTAPPSGTTGWVYLEW